MKHYIIVKFKEKNNTEKLLPEIRELYDKALRIEGVENIEIRKTNSERDNRYSLMIEMTLSPEGLERFDASDIHKDWKSKYGDLLESKAIFDCD